MTLANSLLGISVALSVLAAAIIGNAAGYALIVAFALAVAAALKGGRGFAVLFALLLSASLFFLEEAGAGAMLESIGVNPTRFFRSWSTLLQIVFAVLIGAIFLKGLQRRGPSLHHAGLEAADDIERIVNAIGMVAAMLFIPMMLIIFYDISQRKILDFSGEFVNSAFYFSSTKLQELEWHLHATLFLLCLGFAYVKDAHVRIELVRDRLQPRTRVWLELIGALVFLFAYCIVIVKFGFTFTERAWSTSEVSSAQTGLSHRWIIKAMLPIGFIILGSSGVAAALRCIVYLFGPPELREASNRYAGTHHADLPDDVAQRGPITD
jgi:TRAP-type mannitol/chloroaromatic compound transport system permease small subunit